MVGSAPETSAPRPAETYQAARLELGDDANDARHFALLELGQPDRQVERLPVVAFEQYLGQKAMGLRSNFDARFNLIEQSKWPEVEPVARIESRGYAGQMMQRRSPTPFDRPIFDVIDDERARMNGFHQQRELGRRRVLAGPEMPALIDELGAKLLSRTAQELVKRRIERLAPETPGNVLRRPVAEIGQRSRREFAVESFDQKALSFDGESGTSHGVAPMAARIEIPRGGRPHRSRKRSPRVVSSA